MMYVGIGWPMWHGICIEWHMNTAQHPLSGGKKKEYDVGVTVTTLALRGWPSNTNEYFFQLCVLGHIAVIKATIKTWQLCVLYL